MAVKGQKRLGKCKISAWNVKQIAIEGLLKQTEANSFFFLEKTCIKECLEVEETQVVWCGHLEKKYFY